MIWLILLGYLGWAGSSSPLSSNCIRPAREKTKILIGLSSEGSRIPPGAARDAGDVTLASPLVKALTMEFHFAVWSALLSMNPGSIR